MAVPASTPHRPTLRSAPACPPGPEPAPQGRLAWVDLARGFCVIAVVLVHVTVLHEAPLTPSPDGHPLLKAWLLVNTALGDVRMPMLLLLSGWLAAPKVRAGLAAARTRLSILTNAYLYVVWVAVYAALETLVPARVGFSVFSEDHSLTHLLAALVYPQYGPLWYVWLLALITAVLAATRRWPPALVLGLLAATGWWASAAAGDLAGWPRAIFFALGVFLGPRFFALARSRRAVLASVIAGPILVAAGHVVGTGWAYPVQLLAAPPLIVALLAAAMGLARVPLVARPGAWVGRRTLGVYVLHWPILGVLMILGHDFHARFARFLSADVAVVAYAVAVTGLVVGLCLVVEPLLRRLRLGLLFTPPDALARWAGRAPTARPRPAVVTAPAAVPAQR